MLTQAQKGEKFQDLHHDTGPFVLPNVWDIGSAQLFAGLGYKALATTSSGFAYTHNFRDGEGDFGLDQALAHARTIGEATGLPVSADLENGYSDDPDGLAETITKTAAAGLVGCTIEDTHPGEPGFYPFDVAVARIEAAVKAARSLPFPFMVTARADGLIKGLYDLDEAIRRLQAYEAVGAPVVYAPFLKSLDEISRVCASVKAPVNHLGGLGVPGETVASLGEAGVKRISLGGSLARVALGAAYRAGKQIAETGTFDEVTAAPGWNPVLAAINAGKLM
ncbi:isocitrate lyase/PEP mutase family protein [Microbaculum marinisediminis]|uniref:Isocitrate lyase/phosphoenolpyruvate mutase family protein n=1 Tax=Microbaculum marinisediminis TaxID=2931392 RepID=A0AAW5QUG4_9HYPH|nr:isocitrate lyase/phosphoenolpyruvate mutase family protein [Microbaculum sp. A6E488]MCT8971537.1 isocitrate lyase/phosphoenolpyruvate mutase family protein [Microbaculum sp. A6E488]